jgi:DNA-binding response OmpR family regulator
MVNVLLVAADGKETHETGNRLAWHGYQVDRVDSGREALKSYEDADMVLLDLELPDLDGVEVCRLIRADSDTPMITLTASQTHLDRVLSLQAGADDCMAKPFEFRELIARIDAVLRRVAIPSSAPFVITFGPLSVDPRSRRVQLNDRQISLTRKEFDLLHLLASSPETVVSRRELMSKIWADEWATTSRTVDTHVSSLRNKLGHGDWIVTVRGVGYRLGSGTTCLKSLQT